MKEFKITVPEGMEIDKENSTFECIKFKPIKDNKWKDDINTKFAGYYITKDAKIQETGLVFNESRNYNVFATEKQAKSALAMARISQIIANDDRFGGIVTDEEWNDCNMYKYCIQRSGNKISPTGCYSVYCFLAFHTSKQCDLFLKENKDLIEDYFMI